MPIARAFARLWYAMGAALVAALACLPWLVPLSYRALGFEPRLAHDGSFAAFQAHLATTALRRQFMGGVLALALAFGVCSLAAIVLRALRRIHIPWALLALGGVVGAAVACLVALGGLAAPACC